ncbi:hypothetical protein KJ865_14845, partial [Myxococcota bacterium]|nr:hypothetical protein [Myxococcota bacterium]
QRKIDRGKRKGDGDMYVLIPRGAKMAKRPKTIAEWRKERLAKAKQEKGYILIPMELWNGEAFHALKKAEKLVLLEGLSQLR